MPPKSSKKPSKPSPSRSLSSSSDRSSPSAAARREQQGPVNDEHLSRSLLDQASLKYPSLISPSSFIGQITAVDSNPSGHAATLWLSEAAMVTSSLFPGSLVSVMAGLIAVLYYFPFNLAGIRWLQSTPKAKSPLQPTCLYPMFDIFINLSILTNY
eukprot:TRINITY_DN5065_c0_g1_i5.p1 TRINITY_DN5065_c0_g1~~TRINITY_DN5065_c0_g1_i5.p1  ORF type:complete len:156 (+),score=22.47 TRINITY_DN5065_c0_g1_i5:110-577(+)